MLGLFFIMDYEKIWDDIIEEYGNPNETTKINKIRICKKCHRAEDHSNTGKHCKKCCAKSNKEWRENNKEKVKEDKKTYRENNHYQISCRRMLNKFLKRCDETINHSISKNINTLLGYSPKDLQIHLEELGYDKSIHHIDHKIPMSWFKNNTPPDVVHHLFNLQPLSVDENETKGNRYADRICEEYRYMILPYIKDKYIQII